jgi:hypothetical protein
VSAHKNAKGARGRSSKKWRATMGSPDNKKPAWGAGSLQNDYATRRRDKGRVGRPEVQGIATDRNSCQRAPVWARPRARAPAWQQGGRRARVRHAALGAVMISRCCIACRAPVSQTWHRDCRDCFRPDPSQVRRMRLVARCLGTRVVFVSDWPLIGELFDARGRYVESWRWR